MFLGMGRQFIDEAIGWVGAFLLILAYGLLSFGILLSSSFEYQALNLFASLGLLYISLKKKVYQGVTINVLWAVVALFALFRLFFG
jgi:hypothetical protein